MTTTQRVLAGLAAGAILGLALAWWEPNAAATAAAIAQPIGKLWLSALQMTVVPLVFALVVLGVNGARDAALAGNSSVRIERNAAFARYPLVDQGVAGPGIERHRIASHGHVGDVGNTADVDEDDRKASRIRLRQRTGERRMVGRHQRSALPAMNHVVGAHVINHRQAGPLRQKAAVTQLDGQSNFRAVQNGLAVETNQYRFSPGAGACLQKRFYGHGVA